MPAEVSSSSIENIKTILLDQKRPMKERFRALFTLKNLAGVPCIEAIAECFADPSALLKHEAAFCLGQMQDKHAIPALLQVLEDPNQEPIVRHEAGEALGAIESPDTLEILRKYENDPIVELAETCQLAVRRIEWVNASEEDRKNLPTSPYLSVDPAPASTETDISKLRQTLLDESLPLFDRYRAMFTLRNIGNKDAVLALAAGLKCSSALFRHEVAYVLGQVQSEHSVAALSENLRDEAENSMVRHECAEALGSIATKECMSLLNQYLSDSQPVVKESCEVALDMCEYENSDQFQYADSLNTVSS